MNNAEKADERLSVRIPAGLRKRLRAASLAQERSESNITKIALDRYLPPPERGGVNSPQKASAVSREAADVASSIDERLRKRHKGPQR